MNTDHSDPPETIVRLQGESIRDQDWEVIRKLAAEQKAREAEAALQAELEASQELQPEPVAEPRFFRRLSAALDSIRAKALESIEVEPDSENLPTGSALLDESPEETADSRSTSRDEGIGPESSPPEIVASGDRRVTNPDEDDAWLAWDRAIAYACTSLKPESPNQTVVDYGKFLK